MKKALVFIVLLFVCFAGFPQQGQNVIKISENLELIKISETAYIHVSYKNHPKWGRVGANGLIYIDNAKAFLFDTPWNNEQTKMLYNWCKDSMNIEIVGFVPNHWHEDCMGGMDFVNSKKIDSYAHQLTIKIAKEEGLAYPANGFTDSLALKLNQKPIQCYFLGAAHSTDNIAVYLPAEKILFAACIVKDIHAKNLGNTADGDVEAYPNTLNNLLEKFPEAKIVIPGHGNFGDLELIKHTLSLTTN